MKKLVVLMLTFVMIFSTVAFAGVEEVNLSEMSLDELVSLRTQITAEINSRLEGNGEPFYPGLYEVGKDIKPGSYIITNLTPEEEDSVDTWMDYYIGHYDDEKDDIVIDLHMYVHAGTSNMFTLEEGQVFKLYSDKSKATLEVVEQKPSWAP